MSTAYQTLQGVPPTSAEAGYESATGSRICERRARRVNGGRRKQARVFSTPERARLTHRCSICIHDHDVDDDVDGGDYDAYL